jgi:WD40 repeat protein
MMNKKIKLEDSIETNSDHVVYKKLIGHEHQIIYALIYGNNLITSDTNKVDITWNLKTGEKIDKKISKEQKRLENCDRHLYSKDGCGCFHTNGNFDTDYTVFHFKYDDNKIIRGVLHNDKIVKRYFIGHESEITHINFLSKNILISSSLDKTIKLWDVNSTECLMTLHHKEPVYRFIIDSKKLVAWEYGNKDVHYWDINDYKPEKRQLLFYLYYKDTKSPMHKSRFPLDMLKVLFFHAGLYKNKNF